MLMITRTPLCRLRVEVHVLAQMHLGEAARAQETPQAVVAECLHHEAVHSTRVFQLSRSIQQVSQSWNACFSLCSGYGSRERTPARKLRTRMERSRSLVHTSSPFSLHSRVLKRATMFPPASKVRGP